MDENRQSLAICWSNSLQTKSPKWLLSKQEILQMEGHLDSTTATSPFCKWENWDRDRALLSWRWWAGGPGWRTRRNLRIIQSHLQEHPWTQEETETRREVGEIVQGLPAKLLWSWSRNQGFWLSPQACGLPHREMRGTPKECLTALSRTQLFFALRKDF